MTVTHILIITLLLTLSNSVFSTNSNCSNIANDADRLRCYDTNPATTQDVDSDNHEVLPREHFNYLTKRKVFLTTPYEPIYFMPVAYNSQPNTAPFTTATPLKLDENEVKFQISTRIKVTDDLLHQNGDIWFGYTQKTFWQLYNSEESAPFRETNYRPEIWFSYALNHNFLGLTARSLDIGVSHESNGRGQDLSRSWNRAFLRFSLEREKFALIVTPWLRMEEAAEDDDNPNIEDFVGKGEIRLYYATGDHSLVANIRSNFDIDDNRGSIELNWVFPFSGRLKGILQYFNGYGESLLEYDYRQERISLGLVLANWM